MITLTRSQLREIETAAEAAYPSECCGLLVGCDEFGESGTSQVRVTRVVPSRNLRADERHDRFEIDPQVQFDLMRALRGTSERIVGHHHSHPNHPARPSDTDASKIFDKDLVWIITAVTNGEAGKTAAFRPIREAVAGAGSFVEVELTISG